MSPERKRRQNRRGKEKSLGKNFKNFLVFFIVILLIYSFASYYMNRNMNANGEAYTYAQFEQDLTQGEIASIEIAQNEEVPTGTVHVEFTNGEETSFYVTDVNEAEADAREHQVTCVVSNVSRAGGFLAVFLHLFQLVQHWWKR